LSIFAVCRKKCLEEGGGFFQAKTAKMGTANSENGKSKIVNGFGPDEGSIFYCLFSPFAFYW